MGVLRYPTPASHGRRRAPFGLRLGSWEPLFVMLLFSGRLRPRGGQRCDVRPSDCRQWAD
eukprot:4537144-Alexandrium_andersonii.AAC.1